MRNSSLVFAAALAAFGGFALPAVAAEPSITITSPTEGQKLDAMAQTRVTYEVVPGPNGDHVHLYVDGKEVAILRQLTGTHTLETMSTGAHDICIKVVNKAHTPVGVVKCVKVAVE
ncbi:MAG: hypothetical protein ACLGHY_05100 [Gammaproteobacteria bacterium]